MKKTLSIILAMLMLLSSVSCSDNSAADTEDKETAPISDAEQSDETEPVETDPVDSVETILPEADFGGRDFRISCSSKYSYEMAVDEMNGDVCNDAVYERNLKVEDLYKVKIVPVITTYADDLTHVNEVITTVTAGVDEYDLTGVIAYTAGSAVLQGCYHSWNNVPTVDFAGEWWVQSANEAFSIAGERYVAVGDLSITTLLLSFGVFFNQRLATNYNLPNLYETVQNGEWTIDKLRTLAEGVYTDTNGDGEPNIGDVFGFGGDRYCTLDVYPSAFDISLVSHDESGNPVIDIDAEKFVSALEKVYDLYYNNGDSTMIFNTAADDASPEFAKGNVLFITAQIDNAFNTLRDMDDDYGILPYPKYDEAQENYYTNSMDQYSLLSVPVTVKDLDFVGHITEALTIESHNSVFPIYYGVALTEKYARDQDSVEMLEILMAGRKYDLSILHFDSLYGLPYKFRDLIMAQSTDFASTYAKNKKAMNKGLKNLAESYAEFVARDGVQ